MLAKHLDDVGGADLLADQVRQMIPSSLGIDLDAATERAGLRVADQGHGVGGSVVDGNLQV